MARTNLEAPIQRAILRYLRTVLPDAIIHHSASEGTRGGKEGWLDGAIRKGMGQLPGFPDLIVLPQAEIGPLFFEVKSEGGYTSQAQKTMHEQLRKLGYRVAVARSIEDVRESLLAWGVWTREAGK